MHVVSADPSSLGSTHMRVITKYVHAECTCIYLAFSSLAMRESCTPFGILPPPSRPLWPPTIPPTSPSLFATFSSLISPTAYTFLGSHFSSRMETAIPIGTTIIVIAIHNIPRPRSRMYILGPNDRVFLNDAPESNYPGMVSFPLP